jgi:Fic family protein
MTREYERSHPWLTFRIDLGRAPAELWLLLGEAVSKCEHLAGVPLKPGLHEHFNQLFLAKGALATTAIEGNTLTEDEVLQHLRGTLTLPPSKEYLAREVDNIIQVANEIWQDQSDRYSSLSPDLIREFNRRILDGLTLEPHIVPGQTRTYTVGVGTYKAAPAADCDFLLERLCAWLNEAPPEPAPERRMAHAIVRAVLAHLYLAWIHPFGDGNGRTARLMEFQILVQAGVPMPAAHLLSNHYNNVRAEYYRQLERASATKGDAFPFLLFAVRGFVDGLREQIALVRDAQLSAAWKDYVNEVFENRRSKSDLRRMHLVLDLTAMPDPVPRSKLQEISPRTARAYATRTDKTLARDVNWLEAQGLVKATAAGYEANRERMLAFLPWRRQ